MICRVEALRYRCLKYIKKELGNFHILVGPNASGKSTFLDVISFLGDIVREGLETSVRKRTPNYTDLIWLKDENKFPVATWLKRTLVQGIQILMLNSEVMKRPSPPGMPKYFRTDGSNLPWVIDRLNTEDPDRFCDWLEHLRTALPDLKHIKTVLREEDKHRYIVLAYQNGLEVPSWTISDGTLRMLALTILAYLPDIEGTLLIEEPENLCNL